MRSPCFLSAVVATVLATGVANDSAQGQATTSTVSAITMNSGEPTLYQYAPAPAERPSTKPINQAAARSAKRDQRGRYALACSNRRPICAIKKSCGLLVARISSVPSWFIAPANTLAPAQRKLGSGSPVNAVSLTLLVPSTTMPSAGIASWACTSNRSASRIRSEATHSLLLMFSIVFACPSTRVTVAGNSRRRESSLS